MLNSLEVDSLEGVTLELKTTLSKSINIGDKQEEHIMDTPTRTLSRIARDEKLVQLIGDLPLAEDEAASSYTAIAECTYASKALGNFPFFDQDSRCDCTYDEDIDLEQQACGIDSQCVNRLLQVECEEGECRCGQHCQNQRFNKREYAPIEVIKTVQKGFGVRITCDLPPDTFVYEYVGEVIGPTAFKKRMKDYGTQGIRHFYFMALDKDTYLDATVRGGKGRFLNHSCNPNCVVAKWTVGSKMRMGIFTKRDVKCDEELTFNYNVDRYGHEAQVCHCGEVNCVGFIGGKTQTDIGGMDDLYLDALGIAEEVEILGLRGTKKKKGKQMDEDFIPLLKPVLLDEVPKVSAAVRQAISNRRILEKLLIRIQMTSDSDVLLQLLRLHGYSLMSHILKNHKGDIPITTLTLQILMKWPLKTRNKIESSKIEDSVKGCFENKNSEIVGLSQQLLDDWATLELAYRIPKAPQIEITEADRKRAQDFSIDRISKRVKTGDSPIPSLRPAFIRPIASLVSPLLSFVKQENSTSNSIPTGWQGHKDLASGKYYYENLLNGAVQWDFPSELVEVKSSAKSLGPLDVSSIIAQAAAEREDVVTKEAEKEREDIGEKKRSRSGGKINANGSKKRSKASSGGKEKKMLSLFSGIVIKVMSGYLVHLGQTQFKKRAKEVTQILCDKETKQSTFQQETYDSLSSEKTAKIQEFTRNWTKKLIQRKGKAHAASDSTESLPFDPTLQDQVYSPSEGNLDISPSTPLNSLSEDGSITDKVDEEVEEVDANRLSVHSSNCPSSADGTEVGAEIFKIE